MRLIVSYFMFWLVPIMVVSAQDLLAYHVVGNVTCVTEGTTKPLVINAYITPYTTINIPYDGKVEFLDAKNSKRIILQTPGRGTVAALMDDKDNIISQVNERYIKYIKNQMSNDILVNLKRHTDFAVVTRKLDSIAKVNPMSSGRLNRYNTVKQRNLERFESIRQQNLQRYAEMIRQSWTRYNVEPRIITPSFKEITPVIEKKIPDTNKWKIVEKIEAGVKTVIQFARREIERMKGKRKVMPARPDMPDNPDNATFDELPKITDGEYGIMEVDIPEPMAKYSDFSFTFFGTPMTVRLDETKRLFFSEANSENVANTISNQLASRYYNNTIIDCLKLRDKHKLCDWAYLQMLDSLCESFCGAGSKESVLLMGFLYSQSGYKVRYVNDVTGRLFLAFGTEHILYDRDYVTINGIRYFIFDQSCPLSIYICRGDFPKAQNMSLYISAPIQLNPVWSEEREFASKYFPEVKVRVKVNQNLMNFYNTYPRAYFGNNPATTWTMYANTPMPENIQQDMYPQLLDALKGYTQVEKVARLLDFVQSFKYIYDDIMWGHDRPFFAEETLNYPGSDCEDRAILFTRLVRDLVGLNCALLYYPQSAQYQGHLASAVCFSDSNVGGKRYVVDGIEYVVTDPTFSWADIGKEMTNIDTVNIKIIPID